MMSKASCAEKARTLTVTMPDDIWIETSDIDLQYATSSSIESVDTNRAIQSMPSRL